MHLARRSLLALAAALVFALVALAASAQAFTFVTTFGSTGSGDGQMSSPRQTSLDPAGNVYVVDRDNDRIDKFSPDGAFIGHIGSAGGGDGQFDAVTGVAVDPTGSFVYASDTDVGDQPGIHDRVNEYTTAGAFVRSWGTTGSGDGQFKGPGYATVAADGNVYVTDVGDNRIEEFNATGTFIRAWGTGGSGDGQFFGPGGIVTDAAGHVYATDTSNHRVQEFAADGTFLGKFGQSGSLDGQFSDPVAVAVDGAGHVWVTDETRVEEFTSGGEFIASFGGGGDNGAHLFGVLTGIAIDCHGIYVTDFQKNRVELFSDGDVPACPSPPATQPVTPTPTQTQTTTPSRLSLAFVTAASQRVLKQHGVLVTVSADVASTLNVSGSVSVPGASRTVKFTQTRAKLGAGAQRTLKLKLSRKALKLVSKALHKHRSLKARVTVTAKDATGKVVTSHRTIKLTR